MVRQKAEKLLVKKKEGGAPPRQMYKRGSWRVRAPTTWLSCVLSVGCWTENLLLALLHHLFLAIIITPADPTDEIEPATTNQEQKQQQLKGGINRPLSAPPRPRGYDRLLS